jgi:tetratricopeptide (TPR) repeat protein
MANVWRQLLQMHANTKAAPVGLLAPVVSSEAAAVIPAVLRYYRGVAAMRAGDEPSAYAAWKSAAADFATPWLHANLDAYVRNQGTRLAETGEWQAIVDLFATIPRRFGQPEPDAALSEVVGLAHFNLGFAAAQAAQWSDAVAHFRAADSLIKSRQLSQNLALAEEAAEDWISAAEAWRETLRRRPRKADHPDALSDAQVATIWLRAAHCYDQAGNKGEAITCLKSAVKYAPDNLVLRIGLVDMMLNDNRAEAGGNELERILDEHPDHIPALTRMATLYMSQWGGDALPLWRRVLKLEPGNIDARHAMTHIYIERAADPDVYIRFYGRRPTTAKKIELLEKGLSELPNSPELLMTMGMAYLEDRKERQSPSGHGKRSPLCGGQLARPERPAPRTAACQG